MKVVGTNPAKDSFQFRLKLTKNHSIVVYNSCSIVINELPLGGLASSIKTLKRS